jgi:hypothetical protein
VYDVHRIDAVWRLSFALGLIPILFMIFYRVFRLKETKVSWVAVPGQALPVWHPMCSAPLPCCKQLVHYVLTSDWCLVHEISRVLRPRDVISVML